MTPLTTVERARAAAFVLCAAYMLAPVLDQALGFRLPLWVRTWHMYASVGADICQVTYFGRSESGDAPLPGPEHRLRSPAEVGQFGTALCASTGQADVRAVARCGSPQHWWALDDKGVNLCTP